MRIPQGSIEVGMQGAAVQVRVHGRATHLISQPLREFVSTKIGEGSRECFIDLADCLSLDSTFAGVLAGIGLKLKDVCGAATLVHVPPRCSEVLTMLGIDTLFSWADTASPQLERLSMSPLPSEAGSREAWAGTIVEAHRLLAQASEANAVRFKDVNEGLKSERVRPSQPPAPLKPRFLS